MPKNVEMYDDELLDQLALGLFDDEEGYDESEEDMLKRKAKMGIDASEDFSMDDFMSELDKFDENAEEPGTGKSVRKRNWYTDEDSSALKESKYGGAPDQLIDDSYLRNFHINPSEDESSMESDKLFDSLGDGKDASPAGDKITVGDVKSKESEDDSFRRRTAEAKKKYPIVGKEERAKALEKEKVSVKPVGKKGVEVERTKAKGLTDIPESLESEGDLFGIKRPARKGLPDKPETKKLMPADMSKLPSTKVPTKVPYSESELFKDTKYGAEDDPLMDVLGGVGGAGKALLKGFGKSAAKGIGSLSKSAAEPAASTLKAPPALSAQKKMLSQLAKESETRAKDFPAGFQKSLLQEAKEIASKLGVSIEKALDMVLSSPLK